MSSENSADAEKPKSTQRLLFHAKWLSEKVPKTPVEGLEKERRSGSRSGTWYLLIGVVLLAVFIPFAIGRVEDIGMWLPMLIALFTGAFIMGGVALKSAAKDIDFMIDAEQEVSELKRKLGCSHEQQAFDAATAAQQIENTDSAGGNTESSASNADTNTEDGK